MLADPDRSEIDAHTGLIDGLIAFGIAWLTASHTFIILTTQEYRLLPFS